MSETLAQKLDEFVERQGIVSAEFCLLIDRVESLESRLAKAIECLESMLDHNQFPQDGYYIIMFINAARETLAEIRDKSPVSVEK